MAVDDFGVVFAVELFQKFEATEPVAVASEQPCPQENLVVVVFRLVEFVAREDHCFAVEMDHRPRHAGRVTEQADELDILEVCLSVAVEYLLIEVVVEVTEDVGRASLVGFHAIVGELQLLFVDED